MEFQPLYKKEVLRKPDQRKKTKLIVIFKYILNEYY